MANQEGTSIDQTVSSDIDTASATHDILETLSADPRLRRFVEAMRQGGMAGLLQGPDLITVLATTENAQLPADVRRHVLRGAFTLDELKQGRELKTYSDHSAPVQMDRGELVLGGARVVESDIEATNGVIHIIDRPLT